jgi:hypothetical protein
VLRAVGELSVPESGHFMAWGMSPEDVEAVGVAMNALLTGKCGQNVVTEANPAPALRAPNSASAASLSCGA